MDLLDGMDAVDENSNCCQSDSSHTSPLFSSLIFGFHRTHNKLVTPEGTAIGRMPADSQKLSRIEGESQVLAVGVTAKIVLAL
jgi:hypothetical protein